MRLRAGPGWMPADSQLGGGGGSGSAIRIPLPAARRIAGGRHSALRRLGLRRSLSRKSRCLCSLVCELLPGAADRAWDVIEPVLPALITRRLRMPHERA